MRPIVVTSAARPGEELTNQDDNEIIGSTVLPFAIIQ
jgi:hypothetical protein